MPPLPDGSTARRPRRLTATAIDNAYIDARRSQDCRDHRLATRPERDLDRSAGFGPLREDGWQLMLAKQMVHFARSTDACSDAWPYARLLDRLDEAGLSLPAGMSIQRAVDLVDEQIRIGRPDWYERNIALPLGRRAASVCSGSRSIVDGDAHEDRTHRHPADPGDEVMLSFATLAVDLRHAAALLSVRAGGEDEYEALVRRGAMAAARLLLHRIADGDALSTELAIRLLQESVDDGQTEGTPPGTTALLARAALEVDAALAAGDCGGPFARDIGRALVVTLAIALP